MKPPNILVVASSLILGGCTGIPSGVQAVDNFDVQRYQGTWYEVARLDHRFERGLNCASATYTPRDDGGITVHNRGYDPKSGRWKEIQGRAYFAEETSKGRLCAEHHNGQVRLE
jgi:apolipoprotein D and lipocalin family protein